MIARPEVKSKVLVAMSGGVDSSVAAALLRNAGHEVVGCFMHLGSPGESLDEFSAMEDSEPAGCATKPGQHNPSVKIGHQGCCSISDAADAKLVAAQLGIPLYVCNFKKDFGRIVDYFVDEYAAGRTPNPCVRCNDWLKFGKLHEYARSIGADFVASGHYARIDADGSRLLRGLDASKDQSYVLFGMPRQQLSRTLFPIGELRKSRVRELAREFGLPVFDKPDSQEICFVPDNDYAGLISRRRPDLARPGTIVDENGAALGEHDGQHRFTIGQRRGLSLSLGHPVYVVAKESQANTVTVGPRERLQVRACIAAEANWLTDELPGQAGFACLAKFRYNSAAVPAHVRPLSVAAAGGPSGRRGRFSVEFADPQTAVAPGQAIVLYAREDADRVLGGGWIESTSETEVQPK